MHSPIFVKQKHTLFIAKSQWLHQHRIPLASVKTFAKNENYFQIRPPKITALLCPFPALSQAETPRFSRNCAESSIVGYQTQENREGFNYTTPTFIGINGAEVINIQDIQMDADAANNSAEIQILDESQLTTETYRWYKRRSDGKVGPSSCRVACPEGANGQWFLYDEDEDAYSYPDPEDPDAKKEFNWGDSIQLTAVDGQLNIYSGAVTDQDMFRDGDLIEGFNYIGNPFPAAINIQDIQMDADAANNSAEIQILDESQLTTETYRWYKRRSDGKVGPSSCRVACPEGANGQWFLYDEDEDAYSYPDPTDSSTTKAIAAGEGIQLTATDGSSVTVLAPFDL